MNDRKYKSKEKQANAKDSGKGKVKTIYRPKVPSSDKIMGSLTHPLVPTLPPAPVLSGAPSAMIVEAIPQAAALKDTPPAETPQPLKEKALKPVFATRTASKIFTMELDDEAPLLTTSTTSTDKLDLVSSTLSTFNHNSKSAESFQSTSKLGSELEDVAPDNDTIVDFDDPEPDEDRVSQREFAGRYAQEYAAFCDYFLQVKDKLDDDFSSLGKISEHDDYFFEETNACKKLAKDFLDGFWYRDVNIKSTKKNHSAKFVATTSQKELFANCISFVDVLIDDKRYCLVAISGKVTPELHADLKRFINRYNESRSSDTPAFVLLGEEQRNFRKMVNILDPVQSDKACAEHIYCSFLLKTLLEGSQLYVNGVINCDFYPYRRGENFGSQKGSVDPHVRPPIFVRGKLNLQKDLQVPIKPACKSCEKRKETMLKLLKAGELQSQELAQKTSGALRTSPVQFSIKTKSSLFQSSAPYSATPSKLNPELNKLMQSKKNH